MDDLRLGMLLIGIVVFFMLMGRMNWTPLYWIGKGMVHFVIGAFFLFFLNIFGGFFDFHIPLNLITVAVAGFLGVPGVITLICLKLFII